VGHLEEQLAALQRHYQEKAAEAATLQRGSMSTSAASARSGADLEAQLADAVRERDALTHQVSSLNQHLERALTRQQDAEVARRQQETAAREQVSCALVSTAHVSCTSAVWGAADN
jgi:benzoyl-CoA reductase/2-hydroxyglutaryl-CoA dehydratase subunit BcrC/BadD/HgdB